MLPKMMVVFLPSRSGPDTLRCVTFRRYTEGEHLCPGKVGKEEESLLISAVF